MMALFGLTETLLDPPCPGAFIDAYRIIFDDPESPELRQIAGALECSPKALKKRITAYLSKMDFPTTKKTKH